MQDAPFAPPYQSLDLGVVGNSVIAALVDKKANIVWHCAERLDGDPVFCALLKGSRANDFGYFSLQIKNQSKIEQSYVKNTAIIETRLYSQDGSVLAIYDFCPCYAGNNGKTKRPPILARFVTPLKGTPQLLARVRPAQNYGKERTTPSLTSEGLFFEGTSESFCLLSDAPLPKIDEEEYFPVTQDFTFLFSKPEHLKEFSPTKGKFLFNATKKYWEDWSKSLKAPPLWKKEITRAAITLKLCTFAPTGGIVAALTTSIPEHKGSQRNWDYRFCWLRDALFVVNALDKLGATETRERYIDYLKKILPRPRVCTLQPLFGIHYEESITEEISPDLEGYLNTPPVRFGNAAYTQKQNDTYGNIMLSVFEHFFDGTADHTQDHELFEILENICQEAIKVWNTSDSGIWEYRTFALTHTHSATLCWKACTLLSKVALKLNYQDKAKFWANHAEIMHKGIWEKAWSEERQSFVDSFDGDQVDASLLLLTDLGFIEPTHPRFIGTLKAIEKDLKKGASLLRYAHQDDFGVMKSTFNICSFWYAQALYKVGRRNEAVEVFEDLLARCNHLGLMSEDSDPKTGELWGNFPQTYSQAAIIETALLFSENTPKIRSS